MMIVYFNGEYMPKDEVRISPDDRGFLLADGTYEVVRIYDGKPFCLPNHLRRFANSLGKIHIEFPDTGVFEAVTGELIRRNGMGRAEASLYIQITRGEGPRRHPFPEPGTKPTVYAAVTPVVPPAEKWESGVKVVLTPDIRWLRCDIKSISLLANVLAAQQAREQKAEEAVFVRDGVITEGTHTNVCSVSGGRVLTHPAGRLILDGITLEVVREICGETSIAFEERPFTEAELMAADEVFLLGTTTEIMPVVQIGPMKVGSGSPGLLTRRLQRAFFMKTRGREPDPDFDRIQRKKPGEF
jgi:D-alanine transaminase